MAVATTTSSVNYVGTNTGNQVCPIPFLFQNNSDIVVTLFVGTVATILTQGTAYILAGVGDSAGGSATLVAPVPVTTTINIARSVPATQTTSFQTGDRFPAIVMETALDKLTMLVQQFLRSSNRTLRFGPAAPETPELSPIPTTNQYVLGSSAGVFGWQTLPSVVLADNSVTTAKIVDGAVTSAKLAAGVSLIPDNSITNVKLQDDCVTSRNIAPGTIVDTDVADNSVTDAKLSIVPGLTAGTYGTASAIPVVSVNVRGRTTAITTTPVLPFRRLATNAFPESGIGSLGYANRHNGGICVDSNNNIRTIGANGYGVRGNGNNLDSSTAFFDIAHTVPLLSGESVAKVYTTQQSTYILTNQGNLFSCGANGGGELGLGDTTDRYVFTKITALSAVVDFSVSQDPSPSSANVHCLACTSAGLLFAWGRNQYGQLGLNNTTTPINYPTQVTMLNGTSNGMLAKVVRKVYAFGGPVGFSYIIDSDANVYSTGYNSSGQLGLGDNTQNQYFEIIAGSLKADAVYGVGGVDAGNYTSSAWLLRGGEMWATGNNTNGTLGYGDAIDKNSFVKLSLTGVAAFSCSSNYANAGAGCCALLSNGGLRVWGNNAYGMLGLPSGTSIQATPTTPTSTSGLVFAKVQFVGSPYQGANLVALTTSGQFYICGYRGPLQGNGLATEVDQYVLTAPKLNPNIIFTDFRLFGSVGTGSEQAHIYARRDNGELWAWGGNAYFKTGTSGNTKVALPQLANL